MPPRFAMRLSDWRNRLFPSPPWDTAVYWALDLETSGLKPSTDRILSVGMVPIRGGVIRFGERFASMVRPPSTEVISHEGLAVHQLIPPEYSDAPEIGDLLPEIDRRLREGILLVHHAPLDVGFLKEAYRRVKLERPPLQVVDTVDLLMAWRRPSYFSSCVTGFRCADYVKFRSGETEAAFILRVIGGDNTGACCLPPAGNPAFDAGGEMAARTVQEMLDSVEFGRIVARRWDISIGLTVALC